MAPYSAGESNQHIISINGELWQVVPYVEGVELDRPAYVYDGWRGQSMAEVLLELRSCTAAVGTTGNGTVFSIVEYKNALIEFNIR